MKRLSAVVVMVLLVAITASAQRIEPEIEKEEDEFTDSTQISVTWGVEVDSDLVIWDITTRDDQIKLMTGVLGEDLHETTTLRWIIDGERYTSQQLSYEWDIDSDGTFMDFASWDIRSVLKALEDAEEVRYRLEGQYNIEERFTDADIEAIQEVLKESSSEESENSSL